jgi:hypothetical protein
MKFKTAFAFAVSTIVLTLAASTSALAQQEVLVANKSVGNVLVFNDSLTTQTATITLPSTADPIGIALNPAGTLAAVTNFSNNRVDFLDLTVNPPALSGSSVSTTSGGLSVFPEDAAFSADGKCLVMSDGRPFVAGTGIVGSINVTTRTLVSLVTATESEAVGIFPNNLVLMADLQEDKIHALTLGADCSLTAGTDIAMPAGSGPRNITSFASGQGALVSNSDGTVGVLSISGATVTLVTSLNLPGASAGSVSTGRVQSILLNPSGTFAYAFQCKAGNIEALTIDSSNNVADSGTGIAVSPSACFLGVPQLASDGSHLFVSTNPASTPDNTVSGITSINLVDNTIVGSVTITDPNGIAATGAASLVSKLIILLSNPGLGLTSGQISSLTDKLNNVLASIVAGLDKQAINQLNAVLHSVQAAAKTGNMSGSTATTLVAAVNAIIALL